LEGPARARASSTRVPLLTPHSVFLHGGGGFAAFQGFLRRVCLFLVCSKCLSILIPFFPFFFGASNDYMDRLPNLQLPSLFYPFSPLPPPFQTTHRNLEPCRRPFLCSLFGAWGTTCPILFLFNTPPAPMGRPDTHRHFLPDSSCHEQTSLHFFLPFFIFSLVYDFFSVWKRGFVAYVFGGKVVPFPTPHHFLFHDTVFPCHAFILDPFPFFL